MRENDTDVSVRKNDSVTPLKGLNNQTLRGIQEAPHVCSMKDGKTLLFSWKLKLGSNLCDNCRGGGGSGSFASWFSSWWNIQWGRSICYIRDPDMVHVLPIPNKSFLFTSFSCSFAQKCWKFPERPQRVLLARFSPSAFLTCALTEKVPVNILLQFCCKSVAADDSAELRSGRRGDFLLSARTFGLH